MCFKIVAILRPNLTTLYHYSKLNRNSTLQYNQKCQPRNRNRIEVVDPKQNKQNQSLLPRREQRNLNTINQYGQIIVKHPSGHPADICSITYICHLVVSLLKQNIRKCKVVAWKRDNITNHHACHFTQKIMKTNTIVEIRCFLPTFLDFSKSRLGRRLNHCTGEWRRLHDCRRCNHNMTVMWPHERNALSGTFLLVDLQVNKGQLCYLVFQLENKRIELKLLWYPY